MHHDDDHEEVDDFFDGPKTFVYNIFLKLENTKSN